MAGSSSQGESTGSEAGDAIAGAPYRPSDSDLLAELLELGARATGADRVSVWELKPPAGEGGRVPESPRAEPDAPGEDPGPDPAEPASEASDRGPGRFLHRIHLYHAGSGVHLAGGLLPEERFPRYFRALDADDLLVVDDAVSDPRTSELVEPYARPLGIRAWIDQRVRLADGRTAVVRFERGGELRRWTSREVRMARALATAVRALPHVSDPSAPPGGREAASGGEAGG